MKRAVSKAEILSSTEISSRMFPVAVALFLSALLVLAAITAQPVRAQDEGACAVQDTVSAEDIDETEVSGGGLSGASSAALADGEEGHSALQLELSDQTDTGFFSIFTNTPKAGIKSNDRMFTYYGQWDSFLKMYKGSSMSSMAKWSQDEYRKQDKAVEKRSASANYSAGTMLPFTMTVNGNWNWSEDLTTNTSGNTNLSKRDIRTGSVGVNRNRIRTGPVLSSVRGSFGVNQQDAVTQHKKNDFDEANFSGGIQSGLNLTQGVTVAGRLFGKNVSGDRSLGDTTAPSSATTDSLGVGVYYKRGFATGNVSITRGNFDRKYLAFRTNAFGLIDTTGRPESEKIIDELETKDAVSLDVANTFTFSRFKFDAKYSHTTSNQNFAHASMGLKERSSDDLKLTTNFGVGRDSFIVAYEYKWKWDDHRPSGQGYRGRQYTKDRKLSLQWQRTLFKETKLTAKFETSLSQDFAENQYNANDKDRLGSFVNLKADRKWGNAFRTNLMFGYKSSQDLSIRESRSANNNQKDSYEIAPGYTWNISKAVVFTQNYRLYIQYTDYLFSNLDYVDKDGNYNKRGNLSTRVTFKPTSRLVVTVKHDLNKRFNATETLTNAAGTSFYNKDQIQEISKVDLAMIFKVAEGVTLEGATFRTRDDKETFGSRGKETQTLGGEVWVGTKVGKKWGAKDQVELSLMVKKVNAYGPSVSKESSDYWDADIWLKWGF